MKLNYTCFSRETSGDGHVIKTRSQTFVNSYTNAEYFIEKCVITELFIGNRNITYSVYTIWRSNRRLYRDLDEESTIDRLEVFLVSP